MPARSPGSIKPRRRVDCACWFGMSHTLEPMSKQYKDENGKNLDPFDGMLQGMDQERLLRLRKRLEMAGRKEMIKILTLELKAREAIEKRIAAQDREIVRKRQEELKRDTSFDPAP